MAQAQPARIIFDTDMGNDIDDALALAVLHAFESRGEAKLLAVTITKDNRYAAPYIDLVNTFYGRPGIPIGVVKNGKTPEDSAMIRVPCERKRADGAPVYPRGLNDGRAAPDASAVLRRALESQPDGAVTIVQVGFFTNLARLLDSDRALIARKVRLLVVMAGAFPARTGRIQRENRSARVAKGVCRMAHADRGERIRDRQCDSVPGRQHRARLPVRRESSRG